MTWAALRKQPAKASDPDASQATKAHLIGTTIGEQAGQVVLLNSHGSGLRRLFGWLGWTLFLISLLALFSLRRAYHEFFDESHGLTEQYVSGAKEPGSDKVALLSLTGVIADGSGYVKKTD